MKNRIVEISLFETTTDEHFENILSLIRILGGACGAKDITKQISKLKTCDNCQRNLELNKFDEPCNTCGSQLGDINDYWIPVEER